MFFRFKCDQQLNCIIGNVKGVATKNELTDMLTEVFESSWYRPDLNEVLDFSECEAIQVEVSELLEIFNFEQNTRDYDSNIRSALVASSPSVAAILEEFCILARDADYQIEVFDSRKKALDWVTANPAL